MSPFAGIAMPLDDFRELLHPPDLSAELMALLPQIPRGRVTSFGDLAEALGDLAAARWVATKLQELDAETFPVHRVVRRTGVIAGTETLPLELRKTLLKQEGIPLTEDRVELATCRWQAFTGSRPLARLRDLQTQLGGRMTLCPLAELPRRMAGVDVSYAGENIGVAAYTIVETATGRLLHSETITDDVPFPYIPGYLTFRELPLYGRLIERVRDAGRLEEVVLVDGNGILHPRRAGIASMLGYAADLTTIGVSKHLLCGKVLDEGPSPAAVVSTEGTLLGYRYQGNSKRSVLYVSPGQKIDVDGAWRAACSQIFGHRLPEPLYQADRLSRAAARSA